MTDKPFLDIKDEFVGVYSGKVTDSVPMIVFRHNEGNFEMQIPGGGLLTLPLNVAFKFVARISSLVDSAAETRKFQHQVNEGYFDWISEE